MKLKELRTIFGCTTVVEVEDNFTRNVLYDGFINGWEEELDELEIVKINPAIIRLYNVPGIVVKVYY